MLIVDLFFRIKIAIKFQIPCQYHNPARHLISWVDNLVQILSQFVDLKFRPERQMIADPLFPLFWCFILKSMHLAKLEKSRNS